MREFVVDPPHLRLILPNLLYDLRFKEAWFSIPTDCICGILEGGLGE